MEKTVPEDFTVGVSRVAARLKSFVQETENVFLKIGGNLQGFSTVSSDISRISLSATRIMGGEEISGAIGGIRGMVESLGSLFRESEKTAGKNLQVLTDIERELHLVHANLVALRETSKSLHMLGLSTKVQSTRMGGDISTFMQLGEDISQMSGVIDSKAGQLIAQARELAEIVEDVFGSLRSMKDRQEKQTVQVLSGAKEVLEALAEISVNSVDESRRITYWTDEIQRSLRDLIVSVQYQDITRQALEKVRIDLEMVMVTNGEDSSTSRPHAVSGSPHPGLTAIWSCCRQASCLRETGGKINSALQTMNESLEGISVNIADMSQVTGQASQESSRFLLQLESGMRSVTSFLAEVVESGKEMYGAMNSLAATVEGMSTFTDDIEMISSEVELISLNARIKSTQTGNRGAGMSIIARAVHRTATESDGHRQSLLEKLSTITSSAEALKECVQSKGRREETRLDHMVRELGVLLDALRIMQERVVSTLGSMQHKGRELSDSITRALSEIDLRHHFSRMIEGLAEELDLLAERQLMTVPEGDFEHAGNGRIRKIDVTMATQPERIRLLGELLLRDEKEECVSQWSSGGQAGEVVLFGDEV